ncbi:hypothetical protein HYW43_04680 [Candidatus Daviesbacteria bacterium]|nr:hypothetical protein [Candidatus Daviesbacteria bacterium]
MERKTHSIHLVNSQEARQAEPISVEQRIQEAFRAGYQAGFCEGKREGQDESFYRGYSQGMREGIEVATADAQERHTQQITVISAILQIAMRLINDPQILKFLAQAKEAAYTMRQNLVDTASKAEARQLTPASVGDHTFLSNNSSIARHRKLETSA